MKRTNHLFLKTFGCQQNVADSERIAGFYQKQGYVLTDDLQKADLIVVNTCIVREQAEEKIYGFIEGLKELKEQKPYLKIVVSGCLVGAAKREKANFFKNRLKDRLGFVDQFIENNEIKANINSLRFQSKPTNTEANETKTHAWVNISNGCSNFCSFCIVPFARGPEVSRPMEKIIEEVKNLVKHGYNWVTLLGQNVNSYGGDIVRLNVLEAQRSKGTEAQSSKETKAQRRKVPKYLSSKVPKGQIIMGSDRQNSIEGDLISGNNKINEIQNSEFRILNYVLPNGETIKPVYVQSMGKTRVPTLFPYLLEELCKIKGLEKISFVSSNPWDFSNELINVIARNPQIDRMIHLPLQSGDDDILKKMNRFYSQSDYLDLISKIVKKVPEAEFTTDIIVGFPGETAKAFENTVKVCKIAGFKRAYVARYSPRKGTFASEHYKDDVSQKVKRERFHILDEMVNRE
jgi:tRNA A37 methylthiotransferase MiaB